MGSNEESWLFHSPNVMCAHQAINFEREEHVFHNVDYDKEDNCNFKDVHINTWQKQTTEPTKNLERFRLYEFVVRVFNQKNMKEIIDIKFIEGEIKNLTTKINNPTPKAAHADELDETAKDVFNVSADNDNKIPEIGAIVDELLIEDENEDPDTTAEQGSVGNKGTSKSKAIHPYSLVNTTLEGKDVIKNMDLVEIRIRTHKK